MLKRDVDCGAIDVRADSCYKSKLNGLNVFSNPYAGF